MNISKKIILIIVLVIFAFVAFLFISKNESSNTLTNKNFITANPIDLSQTESISRFRGCVGHDYSGYNIDGEKETLRTMKHYITPTKEFERTKGKIVAYAPFNGRINSIDDDKGSQQISRGQQVWLEPLEASMWYFIFFHIDLLDNFKKGSEIKSGELIGYADLTNAANFDFIIKKSAGFKGPNTFISPFNHMVESVLEEYKAAGITPENITYTKEFRDSNPCPIVPGTESKRDTLFPPGDGGDDWVKVGGV